MLRLEGSLSDGLAELEAELGALVEHQHVEPKVGLHSRTHLQLRANFCEHDLPYSLVPGPV
jgi:hypothetical protein